MRAKNNQKSDIPTIAIVGRPNVGKSTLYNRIIRQRVAIESDEPLTTRDRLTNDFFWRGQNYLLVDTAGLINPTDEILSESIKATELAIAEADLILFMVDFKDSMTDADMAIARRLKKGDKPIILVANKCDHQFTLADILKFKWAGFTDIILISAMFGKKVDELLDKIAEMAGKSSKAIKPKKADTFIPVAICGRPNVGKSTLINQIIGQDRMIVSSIPHTTRDSQDITFQYKSKNIRLVDTAGVSKKARMDRGSVESFAFLRSMQAIAKSEIMVYIFDADEKVSRLDLNTIGQAKNLGKSIIIAVNKTDLWGDAEKSRQQKIISLQKELNFASYLPVIFISAKEKTNISNLLDLILKIYIERSGAVEQEIIDKIFKDAKMFQASVHYFKKLKFEKISPPVFSLTTYENKKPHFSHLRFMENRIRAIYPFPATPMFIDWEKK